MSPILKAFLKEGWIQVGENIPVFFKFDPTKYDSYPFRIICCVDAKAYFYIYDEWIEKGYLKEEDSMNGLVNKLINSTFNCTYATPKTFHTAIIAIISDHYYHNDNTKSEIRKEYEEIGKYLIENKII